MNADRWHLIVTEWMRGGRESALRLGKDGRWPDTVQMLLPPRFKFPDFAFLDPTAPIGPLEPMADAVTISVEVIDGRPCFSVEGRPLP